MRSITALILVSFLAACGVESADLALGQTQAAITGTGVTDDLTTLAVVELMLDGEQDCTGTIISPHVILTAAHCIAELPDGKKHTVFTGPNDANLTNGQLLTVSEMHAHPQYNANTDANDIGVLILTNASTIAPMQFLKQAMTSDLVGKPVRIVGYGDNTVQNPTTGAGKRRQGTAPLISFNATLARVGNTTANQCYGDSGGPAIMDINGVDTIIGVNSTQDADDCVGVNDNTRVDAFAAFVMQYVNQFDPAPATAFEISLNPSTVTVAVGASASLMFASTGTAASPLTVTVTGLPTSVTTTFGASLTAGTSTTVTLTAPASCPAGSYPFTVTAVSGGVSKTASGTLTVTSPGSNSELPPNNTTGTPVTFNDSGSSTGESSSVSDDLSANGCAATGSSNASVLLLLALSVIVLRRPARSAFPAVAKVQYHPTAPHGRPHAHPLRNQPPRARLPRCSGGPKVA
ncbi:MAG: trypsin-like serine protease [Myxococcaceae bacterium]